MNNERLEIIANENKYLIADNDGHYHEYAPGELMIEVDRLEPAEINELYLSSEYMEEKVSKATLTEVLLNVDRKIADKFNCLIYGMVYVEFTNKMENLIEDDEILGYEKHTIRQIFDEYYEEFKKKLNAYKLLFNKYLLLVKGGRRSEAIYTSIYGVMSKEISFDTRIEMKNGVLSYVFLINSFQGLLALDIKNAENHKSSFVKCKCCGKYFVPTNRSDSIYCNNSLYNEVDKTCRDIGAQRTFREKVQNDAVAREYRKVYGRYLTHLSRHPEDDERKVLLNKLVTEGKKLKKAYKTGEISEEMFMEWINQF